MAEDTEKQSIALNSQEGFIVYSDYMGALGYGHVETLPMEFDKIEEYTQKYRLKLTESLIYKIAGKIEHLNTAVPKEGMKRASDLTLAEYEKSIDVLIDKVVSKHKIYISEHFPEDKDLNNRHSAMIGQREGLHADEVAKLLELHGSIPSLPEDKAGIKASN